MTGSVIASTDRGIVASIIIDIRSKGQDCRLLEQILSGLRPGQGDEKRLPTLLLYDEQGLTLYEDITYLDEYYLTNAEIEVLSDHAGEIANAIHAGSMVVELGSGYGDRKR